MQTWEKLSLMPETQLGQLDIAAVNLACAIGLPGAESLNLSRLRGGLDQMTERVKSETSRLAYLFDRQPHAYEGSWGKFAMTIMETVVQRDFGIHYTQYLIDADDPTFFGQAQNLFIHGALEGTGGTCSSLPVLYAAVGRRLGYPLKLVTTWRHRFVRWDHEGERFNIECTSRGFVSHPDEYYLSWPRQLTAEQVERFGALRSLTPWQELACFMVDRGHVLLEHDGFRDAVASYLVAGDLDPEHWGHSACLVHAMNKWDCFLESLMFRGFPSMTISFPLRRFPWIPKDLEQGITHMIVKENLLLNRDYHARWWAPLRCNPEAKPPGVPAHITVDFPDRPPEPPTITFHDSRPHGFDQLPLQRA